MERQKGLGVADNAEWIAPALIAFAAGWYFGGKNAETNTEPVYGKDYGLPVNCRAYVQTSIDGFRNGDYSASETMAGLERNCGANGATWGADEDE